MPRTICTPRSGLPCLLASALFLSSFGLPVAGSIGSLSDTKVPHSAPPQLVMRTWLSLFAVYQVPSGSAAWAGVIGPAALHNRAIESHNAAAATRWIFIATPVRSLFAGCNIVEAVGIA